MAHPEQRVFFEQTRERFPHYFKDLYVLEIGSLNINGTVRDFFTTDRYLGVDVGPGEGVDLVANGEDLQYADGWFDVAVSAECFEHNPEWLRTFTNMTRMASQFVAFTCASEGREEHGTRRTTPENSPLTLDWDYYRNLTERDFREHLNLEDMFQQHEFSTNEISHDLYFWGIK